MMGKDLLAFSALMLAIILGAGCAGWCVADGSVGSGVLLGVVVVGLAVCIGVDVHHGLRQAWWRGAGSTARQIHIHHFSKDQ